MKIEIDIPDQFIDGDNSQINIKGDSFCYTSFDAEHSGLATDKFETNSKEYEQLADALEEISDNIKYIINHKFI